MDFIEYFQKVFQIAAPRIAQRIIDNWQAEIYGGAVIPPLQAKTLKAKLAKGYSSNPLEATGDLADSLTFQINENILQIQSNAQVLPSWHGSSLYEQDHLAPNNPKRVVIDEELVNKIIEEELSIAIEEVK